MHSNIMGLPTHFFYLALLNSVSIKQSHCLCKYTWRCMYDMNWDFRLKVIADSENIEVNEAAVQALIMLSEGDMRKSITFLQVSECVLCALYVWKLYFL